MDKGEFAGKGIPKIVLICQRRFLQPSLRIALLERASRLSPRNAAIARNITGREPGCSFGAGIRIRRNCPKSRKGDARPRMPFLDQIRHVKRKMDKLCTDGVKCPEIANLEKITPEQAAEYVRFVALMRHNQRRFFATRKPDALEASKRM